MNNGREGCNRGENGAKRAREGIDVLKGNRNMAHTLTCKGMKQENESSKCERWQEMGKEKRWNGKWIKMKKASECGR